MKAQVPPISVGLRAASPPSATSPVMTMLGRRGGGAGARALERPLRAWPCGRRSGCFLTCAFIVRVLAISRRLVNGLYLCRKARREIDSGCRNRPHVAAADDAADVLRWRKGKVKVKLKANAATGSLKLAYYSTANPGPLANLLDLDNVDLDALAKLSEKDKLTKEVTLPAASVPAKRSPFEGSVVK